MKKIFKAILAIGIIGAMALGFAACGGNGGSDAIAVISREEGSGTRGAFVELTGVEVDKVDKTVVTAEISSSTAVVMQTVAGNKAAIGYISLGSLDSSVKAVKVDGVEATADNVKNGTYPICRPFNIATKGDLSDAAKDFIAFIQSDEGQQVVTDKGCVSTGSTGAFTSGNPTGTVVIEGSSSVTPVMEKLAEAYMAINSGVTVKVQQSDSPTGTGKTVAFGIPILQKAAGFPAGAPKKFFRFIRFLTDVCSQLKFSEFSKIQNPESAEKFSLQG